MAFRVFLIRSMKLLAQKTDGWTRLTIALSVLWIVVANLIYFSDLGGSRIFSVVNFEMSSKFATWQVLWDHFTFGLEFARPYEVRSEQYGPSYSVTHYSIDEYRFIGHLLFMILPVGLIWVFLHSSKWVVAGFKKPTSNNGQI